jgi:polysaccharide export outer membrane protein
MAEKLRQGGETMIKSNSNSSRRQGSWWASVVPILILGFAIGHAWAQEAGKKPEPSQLQATVVPAANVPADAVQGPSRKASDDSFVIGADDVLAVNVWKEPDISRSVPVRSDGKITLPLVGELQAGGQTPRQLEKQIVSKLQSFISEPEVTVMVQEVRSQRFSVLGQVSKPGSYSISNSARVLDAIAVAGGFRDFAKKKSIYILRQTPDGGQTRLAFNYSNVIKGKNPEQNVELKAHDTVVVP